MSVRPCDIFFSRLFCGCCDCCAGAPPFTPCPACCPPPVFSGVGPGVEMPWAPWSDSLSLATLAVRENVTLASSAAPSVTSVSAEGEALLERGAEKSEGGRAGKAVRSAPQGL